MEFFKDEGSPDGTRNLNLLTSILVVFQQSLQETRRTGEVHPRRECLLSDHVALTCHAFLRAALQNSTWTTMRMSLFTICSAALLYKTYHEQKGGEHWKEEAALSRAILD